MNAIKHWTRVEHRLRWVDRADDVANRFRENARTYAGTNKKNETRSLRLGNRTVDDRQGCHLVDCVKPHPWNDAHDLRHDVTLLIVSSINPKTLADRILA